MADGRDLPLRPTHALHTHALSPKDLEEPGEGDDADELEDEWIRAGGSRANCCVVSSHTSQARSPARSLVISRDLPLVATITMPISEDDEADERDEREDKRIRRAERVLRRGVEVSSGFVKESANAPPNKGSPLPPSPRRQYGGGVG